MRHPLLEDAHRVAEISWPETDRQLPEGFDEEPLDLVGFGDRERRHRQLLVRVDQVVDLAAFGPRAAARMTNSGTLTLTLRSTLTTIQRLRSNPVNSYRLGPPGNTAAPSAATVPK